MAKEKKYFMAGTDEEVQLGDVITQTLVKDFKDGRKISREVEFKLTEETLLPALDMGIIEEAEPENEEKENDELIDFGEDCPFKEMLDAVVEDQEALEKRVDILEEQVKVLKTLIDAASKTNKETTTNRQTIQRNER